MYKYVVSLKFASEYNEDKKSTSFLTTQNQTKQKRQVVLLLMEEILHHLGCIKPCKSWDKLPINWSRISAINSTTNPLFEMAALHGPVHPTKILESRMHRVNFFLAPSKIPSGFILNFGVVHGGCAWIWKIKHSENISFGSKKKSRDFSQLGVNFTQINYLRMLKRLSCFFNRPSKNITLNGELRELMQLLVWNMHPPKNHCENAHFLHTPPHHNKKNVRRDLKLNVISPYPNPQKIHPGDSKWPFNVLFGGHQQALKGVT